MESDIKSEFPNLFGELEGDAASARQLLNTRLKSATDVSSWNILNPCTLNGNYNMELLIIWQDVQITGFVYKQKVIKNIFDLFVNYLKDAPHLGNGGPEMLGCFYELFPRSAKLSNSGNRPTICSTLKQACIKTLTDGISIPIMIE